MDIPAILQQLSAATLFELRLLNYAIHEILDDPARIAAVKARLRPEMTISYFDAKENREISAVVLELGRTHVLVEHLGDGQRWKIYYSAINLEGVPTAQLPRSRASGRGDWKVGDRVAFKDRQNRDVYGRIVSLNPKTATVLTDHLHKWRVGYTMLFPVVQGDVNAKAPPGHTLPTSIRVIEEVANDVDSD